MSKAIKTVASIALPIVGNIIAPGIGGLIGGAIGGGISGGLPGAVLGAIGGYASAGATSSLVGTPAIGMAEMAAGAYGPASPGSGIMGAFTGGGLKALGTGISNAVGGMGSSPVSGLSSIGNMLMTNEDAEAAEKAAKLQSNSINNALATQQPYQQLGTDAVNKINQIQADPAGYIKNNEFYNTLASDAERRLLANEAAKGKVGSGGTAKALQDQLLMLGNGLVNQEIGRLQTQANTGQGSAAVASNLQTQQGDVNAAGVMGANNAYQKGYENQLNTLLALQNLNKVPSYAPSNTLRA